MIDLQSLQELGETLAKDAGSAPPAVYDGRIESAGLSAESDPALLVHVKHQALVRCYQVRYILLPSETPRLPITRWMQRYYGAGRMHALGVARPLLETELMEPLLETACESAAREDSHGYVARLVRELNDAPDDPFVEALRGNPHREHHYRNFLVQSSVDLLAEASAAALGVIGEFGPAQSALFRILIDEFGYGSHRKKHSVLFRSTLHGFGLSGEYNYYWKRFDTSALSLHNVIHFLFQNPAHFFKQIGFLLFAETAYRRMTQIHSHYLNQFHPAVDAHYFAEHAHIDLHHTRIVIDEVITPLVALYGVDALREVIAGAQLTRMAFAQFSQNLLALMRAFDSADEASYGMSATEDSAPGALLTPRSVQRFPKAQETGACIRVGAIGEIGCAAFAQFPAGTVGRLVRRDALQ